VLLPQHHQVVDLQAVSKYAREAAEFVNLYSKWRGINRWPALVMVFDLLRERPEVVARRARSSRRRRSGNSWRRAAPERYGLKAYLAQHPDPELDKALGWSKAVNASIADMVHGVPPFPFMRESLQAMQGRADVVVVSATPTEALIREWKSTTLPSTRASSPARRWAPRSSTWRWPPRGSMRRITS